MKKIVIAFAVIIIVLLGVLIFVPAKAPQAPNGGGVGVGNAGTPVPVSATSADGRLKVDTFNIESKPITSPIAITGTVTGGGWFFEGSFPVKVLDGDGKVLGQGIAQAIPPESWMTTGTVQFAAAVTFYAPHFATGTIVFSKDNPSGLPQNDMSLAVPVTFASSSIATPGGEGIIQGSVVLGPTCPVERIPPDPACAPKPYATKVDIYRQVGSATPYKTVATNASGTFNVALDPGRLSCSRAAARPCRIAQGNR